MELSEETGLPVKAAMNQSLSGTITADGLPGAAGSMSWPISMEGTIQIEQASK